MKLINSFSTLLLKLNTTMIVIFGFSIDSDPFGSVKAGMVGKAWEYRWSSVHAHLSGKDELGLVKVSPLLNLVDNWKAYL